VPVQSPSSLYHARRLGKVGLGLALSIIITDFVFLAMKGVKVGWYNGRVERAGTELAQHGPPATTSDEGVREGKRQDRLPCGSGAGRVQGQ